MIRLTRRSFVRFKNRVSTSINQPIPHALTNRYPEKSKPTLPPLQIQQLQVNFYDVLIHIKSLIINFNSSQNFLTGEHSKTIIITPGNEQKYHLTNKLHNAFTISYRDLIDLCNGSAINCDYNNRSEYLGDDDMNGLELMGNVQVVTLSLKDLNNANLIFLSEPFGQEKDMIFDQIFRNTESRPKSITQFKTSLQWKDIKQLEDLNLKRLERQYDVNISVRTRLDHDFDGHTDLSVSQKTLENIKSAKKSSISQKLNLEIKKPNTLQQYVWGLDLDLAQNIFITAPTGTGKTFAYLEQLIDYKIKRERQRGEVLPKPWGLILCPNVQLVLQLKDLINKYYSEEFDIKTYHMVDLEKRFNDILDVKKADIIIATPGIYENYCRYWWTELKSIQLICVDEADHLLAKRLTVFQNGMGDTIETFGRDEFGIMRRIFMRYTGMHYTIMNSATLHEDYNNVSIDQLIRANILELPITKVDMTLNMDLPKNKKQDEDSEEVSEDPDLENLKNRKIAINPRIHYAFVDNFEDRSDINLWSEFNAKSDDSFKLACDYAQSILFSGLGNSKIILATNRFTFHKNSELRSKTLNYLQNQFGKKNIYYDLHHLDRFKNAKLGIWVADMHSFKAASFRGLDMKNLDAVIVDSMPDRVQDFLHVSGRVARGEYESGLCIAIVNTLEGAVARDRFVRLLEQQHQIDQKS